ncbi:MAG: right-handed parallel beta-helix repeat-containing protein [Phycisphaerales bacterium]|jgi:hypothetical protein
MKLVRTGWFWANAAFLAIIAVCLAPNIAKADWSYEYRDNFSTNKAEEDSYLHSVIWPQGAFPPQEPYLYYLDTESQHELGLGDRHGEPASLGYCFPLDSTQPLSAVSGNLQIDVRFPYSTDLESSLSGYLLYQSSSDGVNWSTPQELMSGNNNIPIETVRGTFYINFFGTEVIIDNLVVRMNSLPATIDVPRDFTTIQEAIDSANDGDIIEVAPGIYTGEGNWDINFRGKAITVRSEAGPERTIIDCTNQNHRGFYFHRREKQDSILRGFKIISSALSGPVIPPDSVNWNSSSTHPIGGGIYCEFSNPTIIDCVINECTAELGGGIGCVGSLPTIIDCVIEECRSEILGGLSEAGGQGAGIGLIRGSTAEIINCVINDNVGSHNSHGAGIYCRESVALLANCDISYNSALGSIQGGGIYCEGSSSHVQLEHCIISNNTAETGSGIYANSADYVRATNCTIVYNQLSGNTTSSGGGIHSVNSSIEVRNSIIWHNDGRAISPTTSNNTVLYSNIEGGQSGQGNINADPLFASSRDYHLKSGYYSRGRYDAGRDRWVTDNEHSPCIDAGDPQDPIDSEPFPNSNRINMGAYGGTSQASKSLGPLILHVDTNNGNDNNSGLSRTNAFKTIQRAVDYTLNGDTVVVWPGRYQEEVTFDRKAITLQSADEAAVITAPTGYAFSFYGAESSRSILRNFVITNCGEAAIFCHSASPSLINLTIADNQFGIVAYGGADPDIINCILWGNEFGDLDQCRARYSCIEELSEPDENRGNINTDPLFINPDNGDYHLQSRYGRYTPEESDWLSDSLSSPCIDAGDPSMYPGREQMPHGGRVNIGAYGGTPFASRSDWPWGNANFGGQ